MEVYGIIYLIRNKVNGKCYIGQTKNKKGFKGRYKAKGKGIERVYNYYKNAKEYGRWTNNYLFNSIIKYGFNAFEVIEEIDVAYSLEELNKLEKQYVEEYNCIIPYGYNNKEGGRKGEYSEKSKRLMSLKARNKPKVTSKTKQKMSKSHVGIKHTPEEIDKISKANKGENNAMAVAVWCEEFKQVRLTLKQWAKELGLKRPGSISHCCYNKISSYKGFHFRLATAEEIEDYEKHRFYYDNSIKKEEILKYKTEDNVKGANNPKAKAVYCCEFDEIRLTGREWENLLDISRGGVSSCCSARRKSAKGYHFRYATEEEIEEYKNNLKQKEGKKCD